MFASRMLKSETMTTITSIAAGDLGVVVVPRGFQALEYVFKPLYCGAMKSEFIACGSNYGCFDIVHSYVSDLF